MFKTFETNLSGRKLVIETGKLAGLANGSVLVRFGDTCVLVNVTASKEPREGIDFFPLSVDFEEKLYSVGKIPGSFLKREGKPSDKAILTSRAIDRPLRPLFPKDFRNDVVVVATVLCVEQDNSPEVAAMIGSAALAISDIPFGGPTAAVNVGLVDNKIIINPTVEQREKSDLTLTVAGTMDKITMIEAGANEVPNEIMLEAIKTAHEEIKKLCEFIANIQKEVGKPKFEYKSFEVNADIYSFVEENFKEEMKIKVQEEDKETRDKNIDELTTKIEEEYKTKFGEESYEESKTDIKEAIYKLEKKCVREMIYFEHKRVDGRGLDEIRPLSCEIDLLPRVHGSSLFTRGQTQVMSVTTLGMISEEQILDGIDLAEESKRYMHHYNFPGYSVGEAKPSRGPGRREVGHGALAEKALVPVLPSKEEFPYAIRVVSEVLSSNGSTSQASICGSTLSLMDAGVPIKRPVAGISTGLVTDPNGSGDYIMLVDIQGIEDFFGDMDFKVGGTEKGITAIQVDIKCDGLTYDIIAEAFEKTEKAREHILNDVMRPVISEPKKEISKYAPRILSTNIKVEKIKDVIGKGGETINKIIDATGVKIDIEEDGQVLIYSANSEKAQEALEMIEDIVRDVELGGIYYGKVVKIMNFGAFVDLGVAGKEGLLHISKISKERIKNIEDVLHVGDMVTVKVIDIDDQGKINLSMKDLSETTNND